MMPEDLLAQLAQNDLFQSLSASLLKSLGAELGHVQLREGEVLFQQGDDGEAMYLLLRGRLDVRIRNPDGSEVSVDTLAPGANVGEMALLTGQKRVATVSALEDAELARLSRTGFVQLAEAHPELLERLSMAIQPRLQRSQLTEILTNWFGSLTTSTFHAIQDEMTWVHLAGGEVLFRQGERGDAMYLVVSGRLRVFSDPSLENDRMVGEVGRGESVGELVVLTNEPRSATVVAVRDTNLVKLPTTLLEKHPQLMTKLVRLVARRAQGTITSSESSKRTAAFALLPISPGVPLAAFAERLSATLAKHGPTLHLDAQAFDRAFGKEDAARLHSEHPLNDALTSWLSERESEHDYLIYLADNDWSAWTQRCLRQADRILMVATAGTNPEPAALEEALKRMRCTAPIDLVLLQPESITLPSGTLAWLSPRSLDKHYHLRMTNDADFSRLARELTSRASGLVFSGGGARGYVHIGLLKASEELSLPIDTVGGTSMGALIGGAYALSEDYRFCYQQAASFGNPKRLIDYTFPFTALTASRGVTTMLQAMFGDVQIEDLWLPFFCVSTNLTQGERMVHRRGSLWQAVRASLAIPGIFTPVLHHGDVLVDGGIMNNFPVDIMRQQVGGGRVIGSIAYPKQERIKEYDFGAAISGWQVLGRLLNPFAKKPQIPSIFDILVGATAINSKYLVNTMAEMADLIINYPVEDYSNLQFDRYEQLVELGYLEAQQAIRSWLSSYEPQHHHLVS